MLYIILVTCANNHFPKVVSFTITNLTFWGLARKIYFSFEYLCFMSLFLVPKMLCYSVSLDLGDYFLYPKCFAILFSWLRLSMRFSVKSILVWNRSCRLSMVSSKAPERQDKELLRSSIIACNR